MQELEYQYRFTTHVTDNSEKDEFILEFFSNIDGPLGIPAKITKSFDELINFFEQLDTEE
ncbi:hypothetical protein BTR25_14225 [Bacillus sp. MRMR6]|nr:hypothetical protein BTR25_14225 [Bacillus sp. MRMR6]